MSAPSSPRPVTPPPSLPLGVPPHVPASGALPPRAPPGVHAALAAPLPHRVPPGPEPSLSILVHRADLRALHQTGLRKGHRLEARRVLRLRKRVAVEAVPSTLPETTLYAPDLSAPLTPTQFVRVDPNATADPLVRPGDAFCISFTGFSVAPHDGPASRDNELLLYSLLPDSGPRPERVGPANGRRPARERAPAAPTGVLPCDRDTVFIHYDPVVDSHDAGTPPDVFVPVPAAKARYLTVPASTAAAAPTSVSLRFSLMEIDRVSDMQARSASGLDHLGSYVSQGAAAVPYVQLLTHALSLASRLGTSGLRHYARPDHVLSADMRFMLAAPGRAQPARSADYLRYGYYFFLDKPVEARLYAQTGSSSARVPLFLKRVGDVPAKERKYFPLTGVSYLVMKVSPGNGEGGEIDRQEVQADHRRRLENILEMSNALAMLCRMEGADNPGASRRL